MTDYISREAAIEELLSLAKSREARGAILCADEDEIIRWLNTLPAADVREAKRGKWMSKLKTYKCSFTDVCSKCGKRRIRDHYCSNCGADMRGEQT